MRPIRRVDLLWEGSEVAQYDRLKKDASSAGKSIPQFVKEIIEHAVRRKQGWRGVRKRAPLAQAFPILEG